MKAQRLIFVVLAAMAVLGVLAVERARAQTAPAGNSHPESHMVSEHEHMHVNPFGSPAFPSAFDAPRRRAFAAALDLTALRGVAVSHNGRTKVLDTLARETVGAITGRKRFTEATLDGTKGSYDPLFTLLDLMIDPGAYAEQPLLGVNYLPLREAILDAQFGQDRKERERWMRSTRISPRMYQQHVPEIASKHGFERPYAEAMARLDQAVNLWRMSPTNLLVVPPGDRDLPWGHINTLAADAPAREAARRLGAAWRAIDAAGAQRAVDDLAGALRNIDPENYPTGRLNLELAYNKANAFEFGYWAYGLAFLALVLSFGTGRRWLTVTGVALLLAAVAIHFTGFAARCVIAERYAIQNQFESMTGLSLFGAFVGLGLMAATRRPLYGAAAAGLGFLALVAATQANIPGYTIEREAAILNTSVLLKYHVTTVLVSYSLITLGMMCSLFYLVTHYAARARGRAPAFVAAGVGGGAPPTERGEESEDEARTGVARTLKDLDTAQMTVLQLAFWTLGVGILLGAWWADHSWGRWWAFDPKETWALITWIVYLIAIHVRLVAGRDRGLTTAWLSVIGFVVMLWCYFGVNLILPGLHAYA